MASLEDFRDWQPDEWFDQGFLQHVPASARKEVMGAVRPLSPSLHEQIRHALFAGIKQPFHYLRATGWMRRLLRQSSDLAATASLEQRAAFLREHLAWPENDIVLLIYHQPTTYATSWGSFLKFFRQDYLNLDTLLVCHSRARETVLFWEDDAPKLGKRGQRELPSPRRCPISGTGDD